MRVISERWWQIRGAAGVQRTAWCKEGTGLWQLGGRDGVQMNTVGGSLRTGGQAAAAVGPNGVRAAALRHEVDIAC